MRSLLLSLMLSSAAIAGQPGEADFQRPTEPAASRMYDEAVTQAKAGQPDAILFLSKLSFAWNSAHPDLPNQPYIGCMLYQFGGIQPIIDLQYAKMVEVLGGDSEEAAHAFVQKLTTKQYKTAEQIKYFIKLYSIDCDAHLMGRSSPQDIGV